VICLYIDYDGRWIREFIELQGQSVLANYLANLNRHGRVLKSETEVQLEYEILKCLRSLLNTKVRYFLFSVVL
jgi:cytokinesis protein